ncbi:tail fiber protein [Vibrio harveyi]|uniref:tail fiber protein n=1 Tax=Vibrio harveyi TaxID=669 RepID=UPI003BB4F77F
MTSRWYRTGTIAVTSGSKEVVGTKTFWIDSPIKPLAGDLMLITGQIYEIESIKDNTHLTLHKPFSGNPPTKGEYAVIRNTSLNLTSRVAAMVAQIVNEKQDLFDLLEGFYTSDDALMHFDLGNGMTVDVKPIKQLEHELRQLVAGITGASKNEITGFKATTLAAGQAATATWDRKTGVVTLGIPRGADGNKGTGSGTSIGNSDLDNGGHKIINLLEGVDPKDAVNVKQLNKVINKIKDIEKTLSSGTGTDDQTAAEVSTNQTAHPNMPTTVQAVLDALWGRKPSAALTPLNLGVWSGTDLQDDGGFSQVGGNKFKAYTYNDAGAKAFSSFESLFSKYDWMWAYSQSDNLHPVEMFKLTSVSYDSRAEVLTFTTDGYPNFQGGPISMYFIPMPKSGGATKAPDGNPLGSYILIDEIGTPPTDYLYCSGDAVSRATYQALFQKIGIKYGAGDGSTTFNLPTQDFLPETSHGHRVDQGYNKGEKVSGIAVNSRTKDVYVIGKPLGSQDWDVFKQTGGVGPWVSEGYNVGRQPFDIAVNESNGDLWVADSFLATEVYKKSGSGSKWEPQHYSRDGGRYAISIALNQSNGDVWVTDQNAVEVFKLSSGSSVWKAKGYNAANASDNAVPTGIDIDYSNGDVYVVDKTMGRVSILRGGSGSWESEDTSKIDSAAVYIAVNPNTKDIFIMRNADAVLYVQRNGVGQLKAVQKNDGNMDSPGVAVDYLTGDIYFSAKEQIPKAGKVYKFFGVPQWFVKAK